MPLRTPFIAGNWKMFKTVHEAVVFVKELRVVVKDVNDVDIVVAPPFTAIHAAAEAARNSNIGVSAQDVHWEREGAFTGEICAGDAQGGRRRVRDRRDIRSGGACSAKPTSSSTARRSRRSPPA